jgi:PAS domain S-box-containing protein
MGQASSTFVEETFMKAIIDSSDDAIYCKSLDGTILSWNRAAELIYGYTASEAIGQPMLLVVPPERHQEMQDILRQIGHGDPVKHFETERVRKDGSRIYVSVTLSPVKDAQGRTTACSVIARDIAERRRAERRAELRTAEIARINTKLAESAKELEAFAYSVSHDLRAPLRHLDGFLSLLCQRSYSNLDDSAKHYVDCTLAASKRMGQLIDDLLQFSRLGRAEIHKMPVDLNEVVEQVRKELEPETRDRNIIWSLGRLPVAVADQAMLRQAIENYVGNALKFTRHCPAAEIEIGCKLEQNGELVFFVRDNGAGFDMRYYNKLFEIFQRLHGEQEFEGTGVGLAIVRRVVERHGGRVWAEGAVGAGATFYFSLPPGFSCAEKGPHELEANLVG